MNRWLICAAATLFAVYVGTALEVTAQGDKQPAGKYPFVFRDAGDEAGLFPHVAGMRGHAAGWGDVDGDGWLDLYVGAFYENSMKANLFFRNSKGKFQLDGQEQLRLPGRPSAALFADLDNDGDLDLYVSSMPQPKRNLLGCKLFRNDGGGKFTDVSKDNAACPEAFGGRSAAVLDYDGDGLLDLLVGEDPLPGYNGSKTKSSRLFRNLGNLQFEDVTQAVGIPAGVPGLGVAAADVNDDGWPDIFLASSGGGNVLFINDGKGKFREVPDSRKLFAFEGVGGDNMVCGVCFGDVNRDGRLDIVLGQHFSTPWVKPV
ncbi:MAG: VCBS repeat-containing protein, partial [Planctomycetia bacterium]|nr:VCBS repeat-containing protein [Planctomycetia bacterium]